MKSPEPPTPGMTALAADLHTIVYERRVQVSGVLPLKIFCVALDTSPAGRHP